MYIHVITLVYMVLYTYSSKGHTTWVNNVVVFFSQRREFEEQRAQALTADFMNLTPFRDEQKWSSSMKSNASHAVSLKQPEFSDSPAQTRVPVTEHSPLVITTTAASDVPHEAPSDSSHTQRSSHYDSHNARDRVVIGSERVSPFKVDSAEVGTAQSSLHQEQRKTTAPHQRSRSKFHV